MRVTLLHLKEKLKCLVIRIMNYVFIFFYKYQSIPHSTVCARSLYILLEILFSSFLLMNFENYDFFLGRGQKSRPINSVRPSVKAGRAWYFIKISQKFSTCRLKTIYMDRHQIGREKIRQMDRQKIRQMDRQKIILNRSI